MLLDDYEVIKDPINVAEQQNYADLLKKTIENELIKNGLINKNIKAEEVINLAKIKLETEEYKKQLVLAQSMINSLKSDLVELTKENEEYKMNKNKDINMNIKNNESININNNLMEINQKLINYKENYEKINKDFEKLINEKKIIKKENTKLKNELKQYQEQINKLNNEKDINDKNKQTIEINELKQKLNLMINENNINKKKINDLNQKHKEEKDKLFQEIQKLIKENRIKKDKKFNTDNYDYTLEETEVDNKNNTLNTQRNNKYQLKNDINVKYSILNKKYESLLVKYGNYQNEKNKIKELFDKLKEKNNNNNDINSLLENDRNKNNIKEDSFDYNKIKYLIWEMDNEIKEKNKIILENKNKKEDLEKEVSDKLKHYDDYITNNKSKIKNILYQLLNLLILFKEKYDLLCKNNKNENYISYKFSVDIEKMISQINSINNITNYDIELDDNIFFEIINSFIELLSQEFILVFNKTYKFEKYQFHHRSKSENISKNYDDIIKLSKTLNLNSKEEHNGIIKELKELKKQNNTFIKKDFDLKNQIIELNNKLNEMIMKYNCNLKTVSINNEGKKILLNMMFKFIKNINDKDLVKIIYDILTITEQINLIQINKCLVEEKLNLILKNNEDLREENSNHLEDYLLNEIDKLNQLLSSYDRQISEKNEILKKLNDEYHIKEDTNIKTIPN